MPLGGNSWGPFSFVIYDWNVWFMSSRWSAMDIFGPIDMVFLLLIYVCSNIIFNNLG